MKTNYLSEACQLDMLFNPFLSIQTYNMKNLDKCIYNIIVIMNKTIKYISKDKLLQLSKMSTTTNILFRYHLGCCDNAKLNYINLNIKNFIYIRKLFAKPVNINGTIFLKLIILDPHIKLEEIILYLKQVKQFAQKINE